jgi:Protein of unknown function (DUF2812)
MEKTTINKFKLFFSWQDDKEEAWLGSMSREGWHLLSLGFPGAYTFQKGEPRNFIYRLDFQTTGNKEKPAYLQLFRDAGWEHVGEWSGWQYFRKEAKPGDDPEIFTDPESKIKKYERVMGVSLLFTSTMLVLSTNIETTQPGHGVVGDVFAVLMSMMALFFAVTVLAVWLRIRQLKRG